MGPHNPLRVQGTGESTLGPAFRHSNECQFLLNMIKLAKRDVESVLKKLPCKEGPVLTNGWWSYHWIRGSMPESTKSLSFRFCCEALGLDYVDRQGQLLDSFAEHPNYILLRRLAFSYVPPLIESESVAEQQLLFPEW